MMGQSMYIPAPAVAVAVVGQQFCAPYTVNLTIVKEIFHISDGNIAVTDANGNLVFKVKGKFLSLRDRRVLLDAFGYPIVSLQQKINSWHSRWKVYRGDSTDSRDVIFSVKKSSLLQFKTELDVFLTYNTNEHYCDFKIKDSGSEGACTIYAGNSSTVIAQMHQKHSFRSELLGNDKFAVTVYPHVDCAFIVALVVILEHINDEGGSED